MRYVSSVLSFAAGMLLPLTLLAQNAPGVASIDDYPQQPAVVVPQNSMLDIPIAKIVDMDGGSAVLDKDIPGLRTHPMFPFFKNMTLREIAAMSKGKITPDMLQQTQTDLAAAHGGVVTANTVPGPVPVAASAIAGAR